MAVPGPLNLLPEDLEYAGRLPSPEEAKKLETYIGMLLQWNRALNLVGSNDPATILADLIPDSFYLARFLDSLSLPANPRLWEPGAGGGIPGIPLRILWPRGEYVMIEVRQKRALFLANAVARLNLPRTQVFRGDAQEFFKAEKKDDVQADCILSRAFMPLGRLLPFCAPALAPGGKLIVMANSAAPDLPAGWKLLESVSYQPGAKKRWLWALSLASGMNGQ